MFIVDALEVITVCNKNVVALVYGDNSASCMLC